MWDTRSADSPAPSVAETAATAPSVGFGTKESEVVILPKMWAVFGKSYSPCEKASTKLPPGCYTIKVTPEKGFFFYEKDVNMDELLMLPDSASEEVIAGIEKFWTKEEHYRKFKFLWKRGVLLWGPPGSGKTSTVQIICSKIVKLGGIAIFVSVPIHAINGLDMLRYIEPKRPIVIVLEDIDSIVKNHGEAEILSLLDGEFQIDNAVFLATTNYPDELDQRIINRPSRFDIVKEIKMPSPEARAVFLKTKHPSLSNEDLDRWVDDTEGYSIAHLKELISSVEILELPYENVLERLDEMISGDATKVEGGTVFGFTPKSD